MESDRSPVEALREAERAQAAPFVDYPSLSSWYPLGVGAWGALLLAAEIVLFDDGYGTGPKVAAAVTVVLLTVALGAFAGWYRRRWGTWPVMRRAPREIRAVYARYLIGLLVVVALTALTWLLVGRWWSVAVAFALLTLGTGLYERAYARAAERTRERLA